MKTNKTTYNWVVRGWSSDDIKGKIKLAVCPRIGERVEIEIEGNTVEGRVTDVVHSKKGTTLKMNLWAG